MMIHTQTTWNVGGSDGGYADELEEQCGLVMDALMMLEDGGAVHSPAVSADVSRGVVVIELSAEADRFEDAAMIVHEAMETAIAKAGGVIGPSNFEITERHDMLVAS